MRIIRAGREDIDGEINDAEFHRLRAEELIVQCPECSGKFTKTLQPGAKGMVYHPNIPEANTEEDLKDLSEKTEDRIIEVLMSSTH